MHGINVKGALNKGIWFSIISAEIIPCRFLDVTILDKFGHKVNVHVCQQLRYIHKPTDNKHEILTT